ncbi:serine acetyltransferase [Acinetobacter baumannii]|uniref:serine O-acetyltransferase n=1 Tax=Acinetobacter calcoaceticus/baumannii complex TaxID=909768 RepID=UPI001C44CFEA|nr:serine acetyltransferase [Acinetobacter baumannii]MBV6589322.1 serine acetyltransferase [Acinetobacter baumannii]HDV0639513.1 serine acetyltransferase [Acinetobacter baumannii]
MLKYIKSDLYRYYGKISLYLFFKCYFLNRGFNYTVWFRLSKSNSFTGKFARLILARKTFKTGIDINYKTNIGYGLYIGHGGPLIINGTAVIGNNCNLSQFTTIGSMSNNAAIIEDNVYIGPQVCILENVRIGKGAMIGAGSIITKNVEKNKVAVGNPAKVIKDVQQDVINNKWIDF